MKRASNPKILTAALMTMLSFGGGANAAVVIAVYQSGSNVVATGSGTLNIASLSYSSSSTATPRVNPLSGVILLGASTMYSAEITISGPASLGSRNLTTASSGSGSVVGLHGGIGSLFVPQNYVSGTQISSSAQWNSTTLSGLGLTVGTYTYTWGAGDTADSLVVEILGPPSLSVSATHSSPIFQAGPGTITLAVANSGRPTAAAATVSDTIDSGFSINSASGCTVIGQTVTCMVASGTSAASTVFNVYVTASSTASSSISNTATLSDGTDTIASGSSTDTIAVTTQAPLVDTSLSQMMLSGSTDNGGTCAGGTLTLTATDLLQNTSGSTLTNPYAVISTLSQGNTLISQSADSASVAASSDVTFTFHIQLASCNTFQLLFDVRSN